MTKEKSASDITLTLRKLCKGAIYIGIGGIYILLLGMVLVHVGLRAALLTVFLLCLVQLLRYIAGAVDRLGWLMANKKVSGSQDVAKKYQTTLLGLLVGLIQTANLAIVYQCYQISTAKWAAIAFVSILAVELMFRQIRKINHEIDFELASYGLKDRSPLHGPEPQPVKTTSLQKKNNDLDSKLAKLQSLVNKGDITEAAFQEVKDQQLIRRIMGQ